MRFSGGTRESACNKPNLFTPLFEPLIEDLQMKPLEPFPNFFVVGAPKCGTTSLYQYLGQHPDVYLPPKKELHFFSYEGLSRRVAGPGDQYVLSPIPTSVSEYRAHFSGCSGEAAVGDISPSYLYFHKLAAGGIFSFAPDARIVICLRNPIEKAFSQFCHQRSLARETLDFEGALDAESERDALGWADFWLYASSSLYTDQVKTFIDTFSKNRVRIYMFEEFVSAPHEMLTDLCRFLAISGNFSFDTKQRYNTSGEARSRLLAKWLLSPNVGTAIARRMIPQRLGRSVRGLLRRLNTGVKPEISNSARRRLLHYFEPDVRALEELIARKVPWEDFRI